MNRHPEFSKIQSLYKRTPDGQFIEGDWATDAIGYLAECGAPLRWTEKVDGTNIRVGLHQGGVWYGGRTDNAQIPGKLLDALRVLFESDEFAVRQATRVDADAVVTLYGEGYGAGIQKGGIYRPDPSFILFDVRVGDWWLRWDDVLDIASALQLTVCPTLFTDSIAYAVGRVKLGEPSVVAADPTTMAEGVVGRPLVDLWDRKGDRVLVKVKARDFRLRGGR